MEVTKNTYSLLDAKLIEIEQKVNDGLLNNKERLVCLDIKNLVYETRQILNKNFLVDDNLSA